ncbi:hypothetical protein RHMOL_Rhmol04G0085500 [Rhododendron molle]|uniref:Uncharacterized protein n=1 Tax=Rhododendron molle TaxID=49168 RepID=A0ACC0NZI8_RHOML|nr:hypothetical protein RHMOL_Rhmol04G0085500 [Rhododendron molle]
MVKVSYANWERKPKWRRCDYMLVAFRKAAEKAMDSEAKSKKVVAKLQEVEVENEVCEEECLGDRPMSVDIVDEIISSEEKKISVGDQSKRRRKGQPPTSQMVGPHGGMWSYDLDEASTDL